MLDIKIAIGVALVIAAIFYFLFASEKEVSTQSIKLSPEVEAEVVMATAPIVAVKITKKATKVFVNKKPVAKKKATTKTK